MKICAIVPTYNRKDFLLECLQSLARQTHPLDQIIVVDDGSSDGTREALADWADRITYVRQENSGKAAALNRALAMTDADLVWICDDDDIALDDGLEALLAPFNDDPRLDLVFARFMKFVDRHGERIVAPPDFDRRSDETNIHLAFMEDMFSFQFSTLARRKVYEDVGGFDVTLTRSQDYDMALRMTRGRRAVHLPKVVFLQREHEGARGPGGKIASSDEMLRAWMYYDQQIYRRLLPTYSLDEFMPSFARGWPPEAARAAALLQRGLIFAKRGMWDEAAPSLRDSAMIGTRFTEREAVQCASMFRSVLSFEALARNSAARRMLRDLRRSQRGRGLLFALFRPLRWMLASALRAGRRREARMLFGLLLSMLGPAGMLTRLIWSTASRKRRKRQIPEYGAP